MKEKEKVIKEPPFIKLYLDEVSNFQKIKGINLDVLLSFCSYITYCNESKNQMQITFNKINKTEIAQKCGISVVMVNKNIKKFVDGGIFFKTDCRGVYIINPFLLAKGGWKNVKVIREQFQIVGSKWEKKKEFSSEDN